MSSKFLTIINCLFILLVALFFVGRYFLFSMDWELVNKYKSPNGAFTVKHYRSGTEGGHAPYGDNFIIESWKSFPTPKSGETFFAGYCEPPVNFNWEGNEKILIHCKSTGDATRTQASIVHGIRVEVVTK